jgi:hypothetical protein
MLHIGKPCFFQKLCWKKVRLAWPGKIPILMSSTLEVERQTMPPAAPLLQDHVPQAWRLPRVAALFVALIGLVHWGYSSQRVYHTDLWGHLSYGKLIAETQHLPATEPLLPLSEGIPFVDTAWLSQRLGYAVMTRWGVAGIQFLHAISITCCLSLLTWNCFRRTRSVGFTIAGMAGFLVLNWFQFQIVRPQMAGIVCFCVLATCLSLPRWRAGFWFLIPALIALWANLHGSFLLGLALLGCAVVGRGIDVWRKTGSLRQVRHDPRWRRLFLVTELSAVAALINPYGLGLYAEVLTFSAHPNLQSLLEWDPLNIRSTQGMIAGACGVVLIVAYRLSPRRVSAGEALALVGLGGATLWSARFLVWWGPLALAAATVHGAAAWRRFHPSQPAEPAVRSGRWTAISCGLAWIFFAWTPFGVSLMHGKTFELRKNVSRDTPVDATAWLKEHPPVGQIFNTYEWGDYLLWAGPEKLKVFVNSHVHLIPQEVWRDYLTVINLGTNWDEMFDRYGIDTIVVDHASREPLIAKLKEDPRWKRSYEDQLAVIFTRQQKPASSEKSSP